MQTELIIPANRDALTAGWLQDAFAAGGQPDFPAIKNIVVDDIEDRAGTAASTLRCHLTFHDEAAVAPESVIIKLPSLVRKTARLGRLQGLYRQEYSFYRHVAPHSPVRSPALLYGDFEDRSHRFVLVLEDLRNMETIDDVSPARAKLVIRKLAGLHGHFWDKAGAPPISSQYQRMSSRNGFLAQLIYMLSLASMLKRSGNLLPKRVRRLLEDYGPRILDHIRLLSTTPQTFIHGDCRLDNLFFGADDKDDFVLIDWQVSGVATGLYDVSYFLTHSVTTEVRREVEREAIREYHDIISSKRGTADGFSFEDCWRLYRETIFFCLIARVMGDAMLDISHERNVIIARNILTQLVAAAQDLNLEELLPPRSRLFSMTGAFSTLSRCWYKGHQAFSRLRAESPQ